MKDRHSRRATSGDEQRCAGNDDAREGERRRREMEDNQQLMEAGVREEEPWEW